jgi:PAS domain S-box-containing protein
VKFTDEQVRLLTGYGDKKAATFLSEEERKRSLVISDATLPGMPIIFMSHQFEEQTGYSENEVLDRSCRFLQGPGTDPESVEAIRTALANGNALTVDLLNYRKDGAEFWNRLRLRPIRSREGKVRYYVGFQNPISQEDVRTEPIFDFVD